MDEMRLRNTKRDIIGRSPILNVTAIVLNLIGVFFVVKGAHESTVNYENLMVIGGSVLIVISLLTMLALKGLFLFSYVSRVLVGGLFIVSGLVKANDPWGFAFKLEEYFEPNGLSFDFPFFEAFSDYVLPLSILICVAEIVLGVAIIVGGKIKLASWSLVIMMMFFSWLTWYTHSCNVDQTMAMELGEEFSRQCVTDCGCFGDALRGSVGRSLTPYESFWKDLVLFYFVFIIFINQWKIELNTVKENWIMVPASLLVVVFFSWVFGWYFPIFFTLIAVLGAFVAANLNIGKIGKPWKMAIFVGIVSLLFSTYTTAYLPVKDYRPYAIGNNLSEKMNDSEPQVADYYMLYKNVKTGKIDSVLNWEDKYSDTTQYVYEDLYLDVISEGKEASISDFVARVDYKLLTEEERQKPVIDSIIQAEIENYYEDKMVLKSVEGYTDTIAAMDYDTLYYPDSMYTIVSEYNGLVDASMPFSMDLTNYIVSEDYIFLMTIRDMESANLGSLDSFKEVLNGARENGIPFYVLSPATTAAVDAFKAKHDFDATFLGFDGTEIKIIVRSNPGLILLKKGTVLDKWPSRSVEEFEDIFEAHIKLPASED